MADMKKQWFARALAVASLSLAGGTSAHAVELPIGTPLSVRLTSRVSSRTSQPGDAIAAVLIAPVEIDGDTVIPAGWTLRGIVSETGKSGSRATLRLDFSQLADENDEESPIATRLVAVDNSRESVDDGGRIIGIQPKRRLPSTVATVLMVLVHENPIALGAFTAGRLALRAAQHSAIDYRPGVELSLALAAPLEIAAEPPSPEVAADPALTVFAQALPFRTQVPKSNRDADVTNLLVVGSRTQVEGTFAEAGWTQARPMGFRARCRGLLALVLKRSYRPAAVSQLDLGGRPPDLVFEKQNNTLAKRHHVRMWQHEDSDGRTVWIGAATHDVAIVFNRSRRAFTHRIDPHIDLEREKIVNDLQLTREVVSSSFVDRPQRPQLGGDAESDLLETDGRMAVVVLRPAGAVPGL
jgi:LssY-like putative type I secretion system component LssY